MGFTALGTVVLLIVTAVIRFTPWVQLDNSPKPLGDRLEYIGKKDYGCGGFIGVCDAAPGATYYYGTDMSIEEVARYFKEAETTERPLLEWSFEEDGTQYRLSFANKKISGKGFSLNYYDDSGHRVKDYKLLSTSKKFLVELDSQSYQNVKDAL